MGISFRSRSKSGKIPWQAGSILRAYNADSRPVDVQDSPTAKPTWQPESTKDNSTPTPTSLEKLIGDENESIVGLFGLSPDTAAQVRSAVCQTGDALTPVVDLGVCENDWLQRDTILRRIGRLLEMDTSSPERMDLIRGCLRHMPACCFLVDLTAPSLKPEMRLDACNAIREFVEACGHPVDGKRHQIVAVLPHRFHFDYTREQSVTSYLRLTRAWYRTDAKMPDVQAESPYRIRSRTQTPQVGRTAGHTLDQFAPIHRAWLYDELEKRWSADSNGLTFISGGPGTGKSDLLAGLRHHFDENQPADGLSTLFVSAGFDAKYAKRSTRLIGHVCRQLLQTLGWDGRMPDAKDDDEEWRTCVGELLRAIEERELRQHWAQGGAAIASQVRVGTQRVVIAIDALDECAAPDIERGPRQAWNFIKQVFDEFESLPDGVHVVISSRPETLSRLNLAEHAIDLNDEMYAEHIDDDIGCFIATVASTLSDETRQRIVVAGQRNFLATALLAEFLLQEHDRDPSGVDPVLSGFEANRPDAVGNVFERIYDLFWDRYLDDKPHPIDGAILRLAASILSASPSPPPRRLFVDAAEELVPDCSNQMGRLIDAMVRDSLLTEAGGPPSDGSSPFYAAWHGSFIAYLASERRVPAYEHRENLQCIANWCADWETRRNSQDKTAYEHALRHAPHHLLAVEDWEGLFTLLIGKPDGRNFRFLEARLTGDRETGADDLVLDLRGVLARLSDAGPSLSEEKRDAMEEFCKIFIREQYTFHDVPERMFQQLHAALLASTVPLLQRWNEQVSEHWSNDGNPWLRLCNPLAVRQEELVFRCPRSYPISIALSGDGQYLACGAADGTCYLWNAHSGRLVRSWDYPEEEVRFVSFSPDSSSLCFATGDSRVVFVDLKTRTIDRAVQLTSECSSFAAISPDFRFAAFDGHDDEILLWDLRDQQLHDRLIENIPHFSTVVFSAKGTWLLSYCHFGGPPVKLWDVASGRPVELPIHARPDAVTNVARAAFSPDERRFVCIDKSGKISSWNASNSSFEWQQGLGWSPMAVTYSADGALVAVGGECGEIEILCANSGRIRQALRGQPGGVRRLTFSVDAQHVASTSDDGLCRLWNLSRHVPEDAMRQEPAVSSAKVYRVTTSASGTIVAAASDDRRISFWDMTTASRIRQIESCQSWVSDLCFIKRGDATSLLTAHVDGKGREWSTLTGQLNNTLVGHGQCVSMTSPASEFLNDMDGNPATSSSAVDSVTASKDGKLLVTGGKDDTCRVWDGMTGELLRTLPRRGDGYFGNMPVCFLPGDRQVVSLYRERAVVWDCETLDVLRACEWERYFEYNTWRSSDGVLTRTYGASEKAPPGHEPASCGNNHVNVSAVAGKRRVLLTGFREGKWRLWNLNDGTELATGSVNDAWPEDDHPVSAVAFDCDGSRFIAACETGTCRIWNTDSPDQYTPLSGHRDSTTVAAFSPDGRLVLTGSQDHTCRVWDAGSGECLAIFVVPSAVVCGAWVLDGKRIALGLASGFAILELANLG